MANQDNVLSIEICGYKPLNGKVVSFKAHQFKKLRWNDKEIHTIAQTVHDGYIIRIGMKIISNKAVLSTIGISIIQKDKDGAETYLAVLRRKEVKVIHHSFDFMP